MLFFPMCPDLYSGRFVPPSDGPVGFQVFAR